MTETIARRPRLSGLAFAGLAVVAFYVGVYWWRLPYANPSFGYGSAVRAAAEFPTIPETHLFGPAVWLHSRIHPDSFYGRVMKGALVGGRAAY